MTVKSAGIESIFSHNDHDPHILGIIEPELSPLYTLVNAPAEDQRWAAVWLFQYLCRCWSINHCMADSIYKMDRWMDGQVVGHTDTETDREWG